MGAPYPAASIANAFLERSFEDNIGISPMKIQKLMYLAHGYGLVECNDPIIDEVFEAWKFGPVLESIYHQCKPYGWSDIEELLRVYDPEKEKKVRVRSPADSKVNDIIDFVWREYGGDSATKLSDWTHERGGPWDIVTKGGTKILRNQAIDNELIRRYFERHLYTHAEASSESKT